MSLWSEFGWLRPEFFWLLLPLAWLVWRTPASGLSRQPLAKHMDPQLFEFLNRSQPLDRIHRRWQPALFGLLLITALAGPSLPRAEQPMQQLTGAQVIVLNLTPSMLAQDEAPSRLQRAKQKIQDLLQANREAESGLVVYAGNSQVISPLSSDYRTLVHFLPALTPDIMPNRNNNPLTALKQAQQLLQQAGYKRGNILWFTDSLPEQQVSAIRQSWPDDYRLNILTLGTEAGAPIPTANGLLRDDQGKLQLSRLDLAPLRDLARQLGASLQPVKLTDEDLQQLRPQIDSDNKRDSTQQQLLRQDLGYWLLLPLLLLSLSDFRRQGLWTALLLLLISPPSPAFDWSHPWRNADQQGQHLLQQGKAAEAAQQFQDPNWQAAAQYQAGDYQAAAQYFGQQNSAASLYNLGNSLAQQQQYQAAINAYQQSLTLQDSADTRFNLQLVEQLLKQQQDSQQNPDQNSKDQNGKDQNGKDQNGKDQNAQDQNAKDQNAQDQNSKDQNGKDQNGKDQNAQDQNAQDQNAQDQNAKDQNGKDQNGKDQNGQDQDGKDQNGKDQDGKDQDGKDQDGKDQDGKDQNAQDQNGKDQNGQDQNRQDQNGQDQNGQDQNGKDQNAKDQNAKDQNGKDQNAKDQAGDETPSPAQAVQGQLPLDQETEQWLRTLPDDPGGLLREKLYRRYQRERQGYDR